ncbi:hypothetical protein SCB49_07087 [unidentified eubacterium SCB49]|nr:hypothetical protein SCB49_07087 [unidentified eubacterium SCB49]
MRLLFTLLLLLIGVSSFSQNELLAKNYAEKGEYEKAIAIYQKLVDQTPSRLDYTLSLVAMNQQLEQYEIAQTLLEQKLNTGGKLPQVTVELGHNYTLQGKDSIATIYYNEAIDYITENPRYTYTIGKAFEKFSLLDQTITLYEKAMTIDPDLDFSQQLARLYGEKGETEKMFSSFINLIENKPTTKSYALRQFSLYVTEDPNNEANILFRKILLKKLQNKPNILYNELLSWLFIQQNDYKKAFAQEKAIYKRSDEDITGIQNLAYITISNEAYDEARDIINFIIEIAPTPEMELAAHQYLMRIELETATPEDYNKLEEQYNTLLDKFGRGNSTYLIQIDFNHFLAFNQNKKELAVTNLKTLLEERLTAFQEARIKMELADILVVDEKFNRALIYYTQVQEKVKSDVLAQEARFKVARTSYFKGDFSWAQVQLDVLKKSSSQLIANDALQLSLMISDNSLEDSTQTALKKFAHADLLALQNKDAEAITQLEDIITNHKGESIEDEALLRQANLYKKTGDYLKAELNYKKLIELFNEDILADDAHFLLAKMYEFDLAQPEKAKELYEQIIFNYADSIFFTEARLRFRMLRGDLIE